MDNTVTIVVPIHAKPARREQVKAALVELAAKSRQETGNMFYVPHETLGDPNKFIIYERWADQAALDFHMEQAYLKEFLEASATLLSEPVKGELCRELGAP